MSWSSWACPKGQWWFTIRGPGNVTHFMLENARFNSCKKRHLVQVNTKLILYLGKEENFLESDQG